MNSSSISILFSTNAESVTDSIKKLRDANEQLAASLDDVQDQANQADDSLDDLAVSSDRADAAMSNLGGTSVSTNLSLGKLVGGLLTVEAAKKALEITTRSLVSAFNTFANSSNENRIKQQELTTAVTNLKNQFAEAAFGGGNFQIVVENLTTAANNLSTIISETSGAISSLVSGFSQVASYGSTIVAAISQGENFVEAVEEQQSYQRFLRGESTENERQYWQNRQRIQEEALSQEQELASRHTAIVSSFNRAQESANALLRFGGGTAQTPTSRGSGSSGSSIEAPSMTNLVESQGQTWDELYNQFRESEERRLQAAQDFQDRELTLAEERNQRLLEAQALYLAKRKEQTEAAYAEQEENEANRVARLQEILGEGGTVIGGALSEGIGAAIEGKDFGKSVLKSFGDYLAKKGSAMITEGSVDLLVGGVSGNPQQVAAGAAKLGGGAALIAAGKGLGSAGKDGKKATSSGASATPTPQSSQPVQNVYNVSTNVGMVGDQRSFGREMNEQLGKFKRLGG